MSEAKGGKYIGLVPETHPYADPLNTPLEALHPKRLYGMTNEDYMRTRPPDEEGFMLPGSELLWITRPEKNLSVPMSSNPLDPSEA